MAKTTNKGAFKKTARTTNSKNKITLDLTKFELDDDEKLALLRTIRTSVSEKLKHKSREQAKGLRASAKAISTLAAEPAIVKVKITGTEPGKSDIVAEHNGDKQELDAGGKMTFENVEAGDLIEIEGDSLGTVEFTIIGRKATPSQQTFKPMAIIAFHFRILE